MSGHTKGKYSQDLRVFIIGCPSNTPVAGALMGRLRQVADDYELLEQQRDDLLAACEDLVWHVINNGVPWPVLKKKIEKAQQVIAIAKASQELESKNR